jgi:hypothetical protein
MVSKRLRIIGKPSVTLTLKTGMFILANLGRGTWPARHLDLNGVWQIKVSAGLYLPVKHTFEQFDLEQD